MKSPKNLHFMTVFEGLEKLIYSKPSAQPIKSLEILFDKVDKFFWPKSIFIGN